MPTQIIFASSINFVDQTTASVNFTIPALSAGRRYAVGNSFTNGTVWAVNGALNANGGISHIIGITSVAPADIGTKAIQTVGFPNYTLPNQVTSYTGDSVLATPWQVDAINAAAGGTLTVLIEGVLSGSATTDTISSFSLQLYSPPPSLSRSPAPAFGGAPGGDGVSGLSSNPYTLPGTQILETNTDARALATRVHRQSQNQQNTTELYYYRQAPTSAMVAFPIQPVSQGTGALRRTMRYLQPTTLEFTLPDADGNLSPDNYNSPYNLNQGEFDALLEEARQILLRVGCRCWGNIVSGITPTFSSSDGSATTSGAALSALTDGTLNNYVAGTSNCVVVTPGTAITADLLFNLGSVQPIQHVVVRCGSRDGVGATTLPYAVQVLTSLDGVVPYAGPPARPIGGPGSATQTPGDWDECLDGIAVETALCDLGVTAQYVKVRITLPSSGTVALDEIAIYGGSTSAIYGRNVFVGYLGDVGDSDALGNIPIVAIDVQKKLGDNCTNKMTASYRQQSASVQYETADILYSLLTSTAYWPNLTGVPYTQPFVGYGTDIGWQQGTQYTGFGYPIWQGIQDSIQGWTSRLTRTIGWWLYGDGNGVLQLAYPAATQTAPDRLFVAACDTGNGDIEGVKRHRSGKTLRNVVEVTSGKATDTGSGVTRLFDPNSVKQVWGMRTQYINDPAAVTPLIRDQIAKKFLRDYAWNRRTLTATIKPDFDTWVGQIHGFRCNNKRLSLFAKGSTVPTDQRNRQLWRLQTLTETISFGKWEASAEYIPYNPISIEPPNFTSIDPGVAGGGTATITLHWDPIWDAHVAGVNVYISSIGEYGPWTFVGSTSPQMGSNNSYVLGESTANNLWFYLTSYDAYGMESIPSQVLQVLPGSQAYGTAGYVINDLVVSLLGPGSGPDAAGYYTYQFYATWTSPPNGFTQNRWHFAIDTLPAPAQINQESGWPLSAPKWNWWNAQRIPGGKEWDRVTAGQLDANLVLRWPSSLSGHTIYLRFWNSTATRSWHPVPSNYVAVAIP